MRATVFDCWSQPLETEGFGAAVETVPWWCSRFSVHLHLNQSASLLGSKGFWNLNNSKNCDGDNCCLSCSKLLCELMATSTLRLLGRFSETWPSYTRQEADEDLCKCHLWKQKTWEYSEKQLYLTLYADGWLCRSHGARGAQQWSSQRAPR